MTTWLPRWFALLLLLPLIAAAPQHVTFGSRVAYVTSGDDGTMRVQSLDGRVLRRSRIPVGSYNVQHGWGRVIAPSLSHGTLAILDTNGTLLARMVMPSQ